MCVAGRPEFWNGTWSQVSTLCVLCYPWLGMGGGERSLAKQSEPGYHEWPVRIWVQIWPYLKTMMSLKICIWVSVVFLEGILCVYSLGVKTSEPVNKYPSLTHRDPDGLPPAVCVTSMLDPEWLFQTPEIVNWGRKPWNSGVFWVFWFCIFSNSKLFLESTLQTWSVSNHLENMGTCTARIYVSICYSFRALKSLTRQDVRERTGNYITAEWSWLVSGQVVLCFMRCQ